MKYLLIFDFDGTIANSLELGKKYANHYAKYFGYEPLDNIDELRNESAAKYILSRIKWYYLPFWAALMKYQLKKNADQIPLYDGIKELIVELASEADLAIIGGASVKYHNKILNRFNCNLFVKKIGNNGIKKHNAINKLKKLGYDVDKIIMIGDDVKDIEAAKRAEVKSIAVSWGSSSKIVLSKANPDFLVYSIEELREQILNILKYK